MRRNLIYIIPLISTLLSCSDDIVEKGTEYLNGSEKTPIIVATNLQVSKPSTRAVDAQWETNDELVAYIQHVKQGSSGYELVNVTGTEPRLVNFKIGKLTDDHHNEADNYTTHEVTSILTVTDANGLYWDDFSNSSSAEYDLRTTNPQHALQVKYGYCYNGGTPSTALNNESGVLGWTVASDQTSGFKKSDLLWSKTQDPVAYAHGDNNTITGRNSVLTIPYTHAMSKVTIEVICKDGFKKSADDIFNSSTTPSSVVLQGMNTVATVTAPTQTISGDTPANITMKKGSATGIATDPEKKCTFEAIIVPTAMTAGKTLATINDVDGNKYDVNLSTAILNSAPQSGGSAWITQLENNVTKPGVNYMLTVTIKKQEIKVEAKIADWEQVNAESEAEIKFTTDISDYAYDPETFNEGDLIDLYKTAKPKPTEIQTPTFNTCSSILKYQTTTDEDGTVTGKWDYNTDQPVLYWAGEGDQEYFRAIYPSGKVTPNDNKFTITAGEGSEFDILWGTTAKHSGKKIDGTDYTYEEGDPIDPRTKEVPLIFYHKTSKVKVVLRTPSDASAVDLENAKIQFTNLYTSAKVDMNYGDISNGDITPSTKVFTDDKRPIVKTSTEGVTATDDLFMIPQTIPPTTEEDEAAYIIITLSDNTTYKLKLRDCMLLTTDSDGKLVADKNTDGSYKYVTEWKEGETYTYYINVTKEKIQFFALIKDWKEVNVSGDATMEWDDTIAEDLEAGAPGAGDPDGNHNEERGKGEW